MTEIPVINKDNTIISGHQRVSILKSLGRENEEIDVRVPDRKLTKEELEELNLRMNENGGEWDFSKLIDFDTDFLTDIGFSSDELKKIIGEDDKGQEFDIQEIEPKACEKLEEVYELTKRDIPEYALDCHTKRGRKMKKTKREFFLTEHKDLRPIQASIFDKLIEDYEKNPGN